MTVSGTSNFVLCTSRDVVAGEELLVNYGEDYFEDGCPCLDCITSKVAEVEGINAASSSSAPHEAIGIETRAGMAALNERAVLLKASKKRGADDDSDPVRKKARAREVQRAKRLKKRGSGKAETKDIVSARL